MAKPLATFDPSKLSALWADLQALAPSYPLLVKTFADLVGLFKTAPVVAKGQPVACGPSGCTDCCDCCDAAIDAQVQALAAMIQARQCAGG